MLLLVRPEAPKCLCECSCVRVEVPLNVPNHMHNPGGDNVASSSVLMVKGAVRVLAVGLLSNVVHRECKIDIAVLLPASPPAEAATIYEVCSESPCHHIRKFALVIAIPREALPPTFACQHVVLSLMCIWQRGWGSDADGAPAVVSRGIARHPGCVNEDLWNRCVRVETL